MSTMLEYFEQALKLKEGKKIIIAVRDKNELRSKKCGINNIKRAYSKNTGGSDDMVEVYGLEDGNQLFLVIEKLSAREDKAFIMNPDGSIEPLVIERKVSPELQKTIEELEREEEQQDKIDKLRIYREKQRESLKTEEDKERFDRLSIQLDNEKKDIILDDYPLSKEDEEEFLKRQEDDLNELKQAMQDIHRNVNV